MPQESGAPAAGAGYTWASGTLNYGGESHPFRVNGLGVVDMDVPIDAIGIVYRLARLQDFDGTYTEVEVDAKLAGEGYTGAVENQHGVVIGLRSPVPAIVKDFRRTVMVAESCRTSPRQ